MSSIVLQKENPLKILHVTPYYLPDVNFGGPVFSVSSLCEALVSREVAVTVFTVGYNKSTVYPFETILNGVRVIYFKGNCGNPCQVSTQLWSALTQQVNQYQLIHFHTWWNLLIFQSISIAQRNNVAAVVSLRGMLSHYSFTHQKAILKRCFQKVFGNNLLRQTTILASSDAEKIDIENCVGKHIEPVTVLPNILRLKSMHNCTMPSTGYKLGFLSRLHPKKGIELLLEAIAQSPEVDELIIGGSGDAEYEFQLKKHVEMLQLQNRVRFVGWVSNEQKEAFFNQFHVFVLPSFNENFGNAVIEAWNAGKPVIISQEVGLTDFWKQGKPGWLCSTTVEEIATAIRQAFNEKNEWPAISKVALNIVAQKLEERKLVDRYIKMYADKIANKKDK